VFEGFDLRTIFRRTVPFPPERAMAWRQQDDPTKRQMQTVNTRPDVADMDVPILFEAACACSLASFAGSMVELAEDLRL
jgi:hypothetical protein